MPDHSKTTRPAIEKRGEHKATGVEKASQNKRQRRILAQIWTKRSKRTKEKTDTNFCIILQRGFIEV